MYQGKKTLILGKKTLILEKETLNSDHCWTMKSINKEPVVQVRTLGVE